MRTTAVNQQKKAPLFGREILKQTALTILAGLTLFLVISLSAFFVSNLRHIGKVYSGVSLAGIELSNLIINFPVPAQKPK